MVPVDCILRFFFLVVFLWSVGWHVGALWQLLSGVSSQLVEHHDLVCLLFFLTLCLCCEMFPSKAEFPAGEASFGRVHLALKVCTDHRSGGISGLVCFLC